LSRTFFLFLFRVPWTKRVVDAAFFGVSYGMAFITSMIGYTDTWRFHRRLYHQVFRSEVAQTFRPMQLRKVHQLARNIMLAPEDFYEHLHTLGTAVAMAAVYDYDIEPRHDPLVKVVDNAISNMIGAPEQGALVGAFPFLKYIPPWLPGGRYNASVSKKYANILVNTPFRALKERMERGEAIHGLGTVSLRRFQEEDETGELVETIRNACATAFAAGSDTTTATLVIFVYAMMNNPEIQAKAQAELDTVVGHGRLPTYEDKPALPYIEAVLRETLRWFPIVPLGVWHATSEDDVYEGHYIPKGAAVISNIWAIARNPAKYPNPDKFIPERFLGPDGQPTDDTAMYAFGFGRRVCAGRHVALNSVWMSMATILTLFNIRKPKDEHGREISPKLPYSTGVVTTPLAYPCHISPRNPDIDMERLNDMISDIYDE